MNKSKKIAIILLLILVLIVLMVIGMYQAWSNNSLVEFQYREPNTLIKNESIPEEINRFYVMYNQSDFEGIADMFDTTSINTYYNSRQGLIWYLKFYKEAYGNNTNHTLSQTHKAVSSDNQFVYNFRSTYENVTLETDDTFTVLLNKENEEMSFKMFSPGLSKELR